MVAVSGGEVRFVRPEGSAMIFDLHNHSYLSHDGFTRPLELVAACKARGIDAIAITEHDLLCEIDSEIFIEHGIELIPGCEYTDSTGAHIIGLFVETGLGAGADASAILSNIHEQGGFAVMPHPWKPGSGFMAVNGDLQLLPCFDFIELINGGWRAREYASDIIDLANRFNLRMLASSDSHKACHVGLACTDIRKRQADQDARSVLSGASQEDIRLLLDKSLLEKVGRRSNFVQKSAVYQRLLPVVPKSVRRLIKKFRYRLGAERLLGPANLRKVDISSCPW